MSIYLPIQIWFSLFPSGYRVCIKFFLRKIWSVISKLQVKVISVIETCKQYIYVHKDFLSRTVASKHKLFKLVACFRKHVNFSQYPWISQKPSITFGFLSPNQNLSPNIWGQTSKKINGYHAIWKTKLYKNLFTFTLKEKEPCVVALFIYMHLWCI
jgi:hypothetical protein